MVGPYVFHCHVKKTFWLGLKKNMPPLIHTHRNVKWAAPKQNIAKLTVSNG
jgi:hypothetical protein